MCSCALAVQLATSPCTGQRLPDTMCTLVVLPRTRHAWSPQRGAQAPGELSPAIRALDTHDLCRGLRRHPANRTLACIWRTQNVARGQDKSHSRLHFAHSTRTILWVARGPDKSRSAALRLAGGSAACSVRCSSKWNLNSRLHFAHWTHTISGHTRSPQKVALSVDVVRPALRVKREFTKGEMFFH